MEKRQISVNECYYPAFFTGHRFVLLMGGRAAGRSYLAAQKIVSLMMGSEGHKVRIAIMRQNYIDIRDSIFKNVSDMIREMGLDEDPGLNFVIRESNYTIDSKWGQIVPRSFRKTGSQDAKLKSLANFTHIFIEEFEEVTEETAFETLVDSLRDRVDPNTRKTVVATQVYLMCNPPAAEHWVIKKYFNLIQVENIPEKIGIFYKPELKSEYEKEWLFIHTTYNDNIHNLSDRNVKKILKDKEDKPDYYYSKWEGLVSKGQTGLIYKNWKPITDEEYENIDRIPFYGLDFGYSTDPTTLIEIKKIKERLYIRELIYEKGLLNDDLYDLICEKLEKQDKEGYLVAEEAEIYADSAEAKTIDQLIKYGLNNLKISEKGNDSVRAGIKILQGYEVYYTESSKNIINEISFYSWAVDKNKEPTNRPIDKYNHALDAIRYAIITKYHPKKKSYWDMLYGGDPQD